MATVHVPDTPTSLTSESDIRRFLGERGIVYDVWPTTELEPQATDADLLASLKPRLDAFMTRGGYRTVDVVTVTSETPNLPAIRDKFLREHTHSEDEVRIFIDGEGLFWFHIEHPRDEVFAVLCRRGDLISVPAHTKHWFELGPRPAVRAIRIFTDQAGWVPHYTDSGLEQRYQDGRWQFAAC